MVIRIFWLNITNGCVYSELNKQINSNLTKLKDKSTTYLDFTESI